MATGKVNGVCCMDCFWANLHRYNDNPVLAECRNKPDYYNERFPYAVDVASRKKECKMHMHQDGKTIQLRVKAA